jgi:subfamily B ATP-binding cassette protein MsbA
MNDADGAKNLIGAGVIEFVGSAFTAIIASGYLMHLSRVITGITLLLSFAFMFALKKSFQAIRPIFVEAAEITSEVTGRLTESLGAARLVKVYHAEASEAEVFSRGARRLLTNAVHALSAQSYVSLYSTLLIGFIGCVVMGLGAYSVVKGHLTVGDYVAYNMVLAMMISPLVQLVSVGTQYTQAIAGLDRIAAVMGETREDEDRSRKVELTTIRGEVEFSNVTFAYREDNTVLHGVSFRSWPGMLTAFVGPSGAGKSTIINLICGFYKAQSGVITIDGIDLSSIILASYRPMLGVVLQEGFLFDGTIRENVMFSKAVASEEEFVRACRIARVDEFAERMDSGYEAIVGERGVKLSGGQRQRISIARAILADPRILILDEATSSLDSENERVIQEALEFLMRGRTTFIIAHRMSTILKADQILLVDEGRVIERGTHESLFASRGRYYELYTTHQESNTNTFVAGSECRRTAEL